MNTFLRFPGNKSKALTLSYDDGVETDVRLIEIMKKNGLLGTFNINSGRFAPEGTVYAPGTIHRRMSESGILAAYKDSGMEVAVHGYTHPFLESLPESLCTYEIVKDREKLESLFGYIIRGMAYPYGTHNDNVVRILKDCGIAYSRTTKTTENFGIPDNWLLLDPTCHHNNPNLMPLLEKFLTTDYKQRPAMFYLWGHSYEFDGNNNWNVIEKFAEKAGGHDNIWYATNIQIVDYVNAFRSLQFGMDGSLVHNPTSTVLYMNSCGHDFVIDPGETIHIDRD